MAGGGPMKIAKITDIVAKIFVIYANAVCFPTPTGKWAFQEKWA